MLFSGQPSSYSVGSVLDRFQLKEEQPSLISLEPLSWVHLNNAIYVSLIVQTFCSVPAEKGTEIAAAS